MVFRNNKAHLPVAFEDGTKFHSLVTCFIGSYLYTSSLTAIKNISLTGFLKLSIPDFFYFLMQILRQIWPFFNRFWPKKPKFLRNIPWSSSPPQSDFQGKKFLRKNFHPFSGLFQWTGPVGIMGTTERVKIFPQKFFALKVGLGREELQGIAKNFTNFSLRKKLWYVYTYIFKSRCIVNDFFFAFLTLLCFSFELS